LAINWYARSLFTDLNYYNEVATRNKLYNYLTNLKSYTSTLEKLIELLKTKETVDFAEDQSIFIRT